MSQSITKSKRSSRRSKRVEEVEDISELISSLQPIKVRHDYAMKVLGLLAAQMLVVVLVDQYYVQRTQSVKDMCTNYRERVILVGALVLAGVVFLAKTAENLKEKAMGWQLFAAESVAVCILCAGSILTEEEGASPGGRMAIVFLAIFAALAAFCFQVNMDINGYPSLGVAIAAFLIPVYFEVLKFKTSSASIISLIYGLFFAAHLFGLRDILAGQPIVKVSVDDYIVGALFPILFSIDYYNKSGSKSAPAAEEVSPPEPEVHEEVAKEEIL